MPVSRTSIEHILVGATHTITHAAAVRVADRVRHKISEQPAQELGVGVRGFDRALDHELEPFVGRQRLEVGAQARRGPRRARTDRARHDGAAVELADVEHRGEQRGHRVERTLLAVEGFTCRAAWPPRGVRRRDSVDSTSAAVGADRDSRPRGNGSLAVRLDESIFLVLADGRVAHRGDDRTPSGVVTGLRLISSGNSWPLLWRPYSARPAPIGRSFGFVGESLAVLRVCIPEPLGQKRLDRETDELRRPVAERLLDLLVREHDTPAASTTTVASGARSRRVLASSPERSIVVWGRIGGYGVDRQESLDSAFFNGDVSAAADAYTDGARTSPLEGCRRRPVNATPARGRLTTHVAADRVEQARRPCCREPIARAAARDRAHHDDVGAQPIGEREQRRACRRAGMCTRSRGIWWASVNAWTASVCSAFIASVISTIGKAIGDIMPPVVIASAARDVERVQHVQLAAERRGEAGRGAQDLVVELGRLVARVQRIDGRDEARASPRSLRASRASRRRGQLRISSNRCS